MDLCSRIWKASEECLQFFSPHFTKRQNFGLSKLKAFADNKINICFTQMFRFVFDMGEKHWGKSRKCW